MLDSEFKSCLTLWQLNSLDQETMNNRNCSLKSPTTQETKKIKPHPLFSIFQGNIGLSKYRLSERVETPVRSVLKLS